MAISLVGITSGSNDTGTITLSTHANTQVGDLIIAFCQRDEGAGSGTPTLAWTGNPFTLIKDLDGGTTGGNGGRSQIWIRTATAAGATSYSYTISGAVGGSSAGVVHMVVVRGANTPTATNTAAVKNATSTTPSAPSVGSGTLDMLLCSWGALRNYTGITWGVASSGLTDDGAVSDAGPYWSAFLGHAFGVAAGAKTISLSPTRVTLALSLYLTASGPTTVSSTDTAAGSENFAVAATTTTTDTAAGSEAFAVTASTAPLTDSAAGSESFTVQQITAKTLADSAAGSESYSVVVAFSVSDSAAGSDSFAVARFSSITDTATGADSFVPRPTLADSAVGSESFSIVVIPDTVGGSAQARIPVYELMAVARIQHASGPPAFLEIDPIPWRTLRWGSTLSKPQTLAAKTQVSKLPETIRQRLRSPDRFPTELWLTRDGKKVFAGPLRTWRRDGDDIDITADGLLGYLDSFVVWSDLTFTQVDQAAIVKALVDHWQAGVPYGNYGIDTSTVAATGVLRDRTYARAERHIIGQRVEELGKVEGGFDTEVDPETRKLIVWSPIKGIDRSSGGDAIIFDDRNITSPDVACSITPGDFASYSFGAGSATGSDTPLWSAYFDPDVAAAYGAAGVAQSWSDVSEQSTLDAHTLAQLAKVKAALLVPGPKTRVTPDADLSAWDVGDTVAFDMDADLGVTGAFRVRSRMVDVQESGQEFVDLAFV